MYKCKHCGKEFDNKYKLSGHSTFCKKNPKYQNNTEKLSENRKKISHYTESQHLHCQYCNKEIANKGCLALHERSCELNPNRVKVKYGSYDLTKPRIGHPCKWKGKTKYNDEIIRKRTETFYENKKNGKYQFKGTHHTDETKQKLREFFVERYSSLNEPFKCNFSDKGCKFIDELNEKNNWNLQHAKNGGEYCVDGYFLDGYDKELNIAFEYDEKRHYKDVDNNILNDKDIERQNYIISKLNCKFYRYNENLKLLYEVN